MALASLTVNDTVVYFLRFLTEEGFQGEVQQIQEEELTTPGVDGRRFRSIFKQYVPTQADTTIDCATYNDAKAVKKLYEGFVGKNGTLSVTAGGVAYNYRKVHIAAVKASAHVGNVSGSGVSGGNTAYVDATWSFILMSAP